MSLTVADVYGQIDQLAPFDLAFEFDHVGLQVGNFAGKVTKVGVSLDSSEGVVDWAISTGVDLLICHHPLIWDPLHSATGETRVGRLVGKLLRHGVSLIASHTNWDCAHGGINDVLARLLGLTDVRPLGSSQKREQYLLSAYGTPEGLRDIMSLGTAAGGESPSLLPTGMGESRLEMIVPKARLDTIQEGMGKHPNARLHRLVDAPGVAMGRIGVFPKQLTPEEFQAHVDQALGVRSQMWLPSQALLVESLGLVGGGAPGAWHSAHAAGAQAFLTGEVPQAQAIDATEAGLIIIAAGHYHTENPGMMEMSERLRGRLSCEVVFYDPKPGAFGHPL